ncbi:Imidazole glycerol phosphate synthase subunit hisH, partial [Bienertia sinuspersici]
KDYEELAATLMTTIDLLVHKTNEKIESSTDVLKSILKHAMEEDQEELNQREQEGYLDEGFLSEVNAQLRQAKEDGDKPGLIAMLQKVLQLYAARVLSKRSYAKKAPENEWNTLLLNGLTIAKGDVSPEDFYAVINKRIERVLIRTEGGSYQQRILTEYLKGIQSRTEELVQALQGNPQ